VRAETLEQSHGGKLTDLWCGFSAEDVYCWSPFVVVAALPQL
jgi:hypothetical protein